MRFHTPFLDVIAGEYFRGGVDMECERIENYKRIFENSAFKLALGNTLKFVGVCISHCLLFLALVVGVFALQVQKLDGIFEICFSCTYGHTGGFIALIWKLLF